MIMDDLRALALDCALRISNYTSTTKQVVETAEAFHRFLTVQPQGWHLVVKTKKGRALKRVKK